MPKCEKCEKEVLPENFDEEIGICEDCFYEEQQEADNRRQMVQVTRDMAIDAGDRSLEGEWIEW